MDWLVGTYLTRRDSRRGSESQLAHGEGSDSTGETHFEGMVEFGSVGGSEKNYLIILKIEKIVS